MARHLTGPQHLLPLVVDVRAAEVRERFDLTIIQRSDKEIMLKRSQGKERQGRVRQNRRAPGRENLHDLRDSGLVSQWQGANRLSVCRQKVNQRPSDRDQLIAPDLARLQMVSTLPDRSTRLSADAMAIREVLDAVPDIDHHVLRIRLEA